MKILLIQPYTPPESLVRFSPLEPLSLEYVAASVKDIAEIHFLDMRLENKLPEHLAEFQPEVVGITCYTIQVNVVKKITGQVKAFNPEIKVVIGGDHATVAPEDFYAAQPDYIVRGEGIVVFRDIIQSLQAKKALVVSDGVEINQVGSTTIVHQKPLIPFSQYPVPDRSITQGYRKDYLIFSEPAAAIRITAGCKHKCKFCGIWNKYKGYNVRNAEIVFEEIKSIQEKIILVQDDESFLDIENMTRLADLLAANQIKKKYNMLARADTIVKHKDLFLKWRKVGLDCVFIGLESVSDEGLKKVNKGIKANTNKEAIRFLLGNGIKITAAFIFDPEFEKKDFEKLAKYIKKMKITLSSQYSILTPLPGTEFYKEVESQIIDREFEHFDLAHCILPTKMPLQEFYREIFKLSTTITITELVQYIIHTPLKKLVRKPSTADFYGKMKELYLNNAGK
jgi:hopanoid C-3 methylase